MPERKSGSQAGGAAPSLVPSKRSYSARLDVDLLAQVRASPKEARQKIGEVIRAVQENFGRPASAYGHWYSRLGAKGQRSSHRRVPSQQGHPVGFTLEDDRMLYFHMMGTHDQVRQFLKSFL